MPRRRKARRRARGTGSIYWDKRRARFVAKLPVGRYPNGRTQYREASAETQGRVVELLRTLAPPGPTTTVAEWCDRWLETLAVEPLSLDAYRNTVARRVKPQLGHFQVRALNALHVEHAAKVWGESVGVTTVRSTVGLLRTCLAAAVRAGLIAANPAAAAKKPRGKKPEIDPFTPGELGRILVEAARQPVTRVVALLAATGCRIGEATALEVSDVDLTARTFAITKGHRRRHGVGKTKTPRSVRTIGLPDAVIAVLREAAGGRRAGPLFEVKGRRPGRETVRTHWMGLLDRLKLKRRNVHQLRHSVATALIAAGDSLADVAEYLGDSVETVVRTYVHPTGRSPVATLNRLLHGRKAGAGPGKTGKSPAKQGKSRLQGQKQWF